MENVLQENDRLLTQALSVEIVNVVVHDNVKSACLNVDVCAHCVTIESELKNNFLKKKCYETLLQKYNTLKKHCISLEVHNLCVTTTPTLLDHVLCISTPMKDSVRITHVYKDLPLQFDDKIRAINALPLDMCEFDIILGMDWLAEHHATIDCRSYRVIFGDIHAPEFIYHGSLPGKSMQIISALQARTLLSHGCEGFLATIHDTTSDVPSIHDQPIVSEFSDVFPDELSGIPPVREVEFNIERIPGSEPISKAPYRMAPIELKELKDQLQELLERGFIRPSVSPWGAPVLFVKKKDGSMRLCMTTVN
nr:putative reverse transcriptase domain-containing protein [Tanacetum cinerariifolium]